MEGDANSSSTFWGLALGGKNPPEAARDPVDRPFHITKAVLNEPLRLQTRDEYASLYLETDSVEVELLRFVNDDVIEKPLGGGVTFKRGDKVTFRVLGFPAPCVHLIGHYLDEGAWPEPRMRETSCAVVARGEGTKLQRLLAAWNDKMMVQLVEKELKRDVHERLEDERFAKVMETIANVESNLDAKVKVDYVKISELMCEIRREIHLLREGLGSVIEIGQEDVRKLWRELDSADVARRLDAMQQEMKNTQDKYEDSMSQMKEDLENELDKVKKELKKTIASSVDYEEEFEELKRLVRSMN